MFEQNFTDRSANEKEISGNGNTEMGGIDVKIEKESNREAEVEFVQLYADHVIKKDIVIGPEVLQTGVYNATDAPQLKRLLETENKRTDQIEKNDTKNGNKLSNTINLNIPENIQKSNNKIICIGCKKQFVTKSEFVRHIEEHQKKRNEYFKCKECSYQTSAQESFEKHMLFHDRSRRYVCNICGYRFMEKSKLRKHSSIHSDKSLPKKLQREKRNKSFELINSAIESTKEEIVPYCNLNTYKFTDIQTKEKLVYNTSLKYDDNIKQIIDELMSENVFICDNCDKKFTKKCELVKHLECHELTNNKFKCKKCAYQTITREVLERHQKFHDQNRRFACEVCGYRYKTKCALSSHLTIHSKEKSFACHVCEKNFFYKRVLKCHLRVHNMSEKPYSCQVCDYKCAIKSALIQHLQIHSGEKPYSCPRCNYKCTQEASLRSHLRSHGNKMGAARRRGSKSRPTDN